MKIEDLNDLTTVIAHPDDEIIFGWALLKYTKKIIAVVDDKINSKFPQWKDRGLAFIEVGKKLNIETINLGYTSQFSVDSNTRKLEIIENQILELIKEKEYIFTHNPWGEYGHPDHRFVYQIIKDNLKSNQKLIMSDIFLSQHCKNKGIDTKIINPIQFFAQKEKNYQKILIDKYKIDAEFYYSIQEIYKKYKCWTWEKKIREEMKYTTLYYLEKNENL
jgi:hypothetical protein